jgi:hypothetical protein
MLAAMLETAEDLTAPRIKQLSVFVQNRLGALQRLASLLEEQRVTICAISIIEAADHAVVRLVVNRPSVAQAALAKAGYTVFETRLLGAALPSTREFGIRRVLAALLVAEIDIHYVYSLIVQVDGRAVLALHVDSPDMAARVLRKAGCDIVGQDELDRGLESPPGKA